MKVRFVSNNEFKYELCRYLYLFIPKKQREKRRGERKIIEEALVILVMFK